MVKTKEAAIAALVAIAALAAWLAWIGTPDFPLDDAYIVQHTVQGLLGGGEARFADSAPMTGATSPAHVLLVSAVAVLLPGQWAQVIAMTVAFALYILGIYQVARAEGLDSSWRRILTALATLAGFVPFHLLNGLETSLAMAAVAWTIALFREPLPASAARYSLLGVLPFIRPELAALSVIVLVRAAWAANQQPRPEARKIGQILGALLVGAVPFLAFLWITTGSPVPNTVAAKTYFFAEGCLTLSNKLAFVETAVSGFLMQIGIAAAGFAALPFSRFRGAALAFICAVVGAFALRFPGGLHHNYFRYLYLLAPLAIAGLAAWAGQQRRWAGISGKAVVVAGLIFTATTIPWAWREYQASINISAKELASVSKWLNENLDSSDVVLIHDAGYLSLSGEFRLVDVVGLKTPGAVEVHRRTTWESCGRRPDAIADIAGESGARHFVVLNDWDRFFLLTASLRHQGWTVEREDGARIDPVRTQREGSKYRIYHISPPV